MVLIRSCENYNYQYNNNIIQTLQYNNIFRNKNQWIRCIYNNKCCFLIMFTASLFPNLSNN